MKQGGFVSNGLFDKIGSGEFVVSVQIDPPNVSDLTDFWNVLEELKNSGVDTVDVNSSRRMSCDSIQLASAIAARGFRVIPHVTTRDASMNGLLNKIFAAKLLAGIDNFLLITGDPHDTAQQIMPSRGVYQTDSTGALKLVHQHLQTGMGLDIRLGAAINQNHENLSNEKIMVAVKSNRGADFFMSQPVFSKRQAESLLKFYRETTSKPLIVGIWPLVARRTIDAIYNGRVVGVVIDEETYEGSQKHDEETRLAEWGLEKATEVIRYVRESGLAQGVYVVAPSKDPLLTIPMVRSIKNT